MTDTTYALGHSPQELERLSTQARFIGPVTKQYFLAAGLSEGMRVLDVGSGAGHTAYLAAQLVGESGSVIGTDTVPAAIAAATENARALGIRNVTFRVGDPADLEFDRPFDAIVGRYVLLFQADPASMLRKLGKKLRPGGVIVFHEPQWDHTRSIPPLPIYDRCRQWISDVMRLSATPDTNLAPRLYRAFVGAGFAAPSMRMQTFVGGGSQCKEWLGAIAELVRSLSPEIENLGIATAAEIEIETLTERLRREVLANDSLIIGRTEIGIWSRV
jgi:SAM-dependent methyltransferase